MSSIEVYAIQIIILLFSICIPFKAGYELGREHIEERIDTFQLVSMFIVMGCIWWLFINIPVRIILEIFGLM